MQQDKFLRAELCINESTIPLSSATTSTPIVKSPVRVRRYWRLKYESAFKAYQDVSEESISLEDIPNLLPIAKVEGHPGSWFNGGKANTGKGVDYKKGQRNKRGSQEAKQRKATRAS